ncbi:Mannose-P-dolichol utilization defect 1 protein homolog 2-like protein [Drosera capensis]
MKILGTDFGCVLEPLSNAQFPEKDCVLSLISKILGYSIVAASTIVKVPQISKILRHKSVRGLSVLAFELEVIGYTIALAYCLHKGLPFSAFGEYAFLLIQAIILVAIIYYYSRPVGTITWIKALLYCAVAPTVLAGQVNPVLFEALYAKRLYSMFCAGIPTCNIPLRKNSPNMGQFFCSIVRVFTSIQEKAPATVLLGSVIGMMTNGTIMAQIALYHKPPAKKEKKVQ